MSPEDKAIVVKAARIAERGRILAWVGRLASAAVQRANVRGETTLVLGALRALRAWLTDLEASDEDDPGSMLDAERAAVRKELDRIGTPAPKLRVDLIRTAIRECLLMRQGEVLAAEVIEERAKAASLYVEHSISDYVFEDDEPALVLTTTKAADA